VRDEEEEGKERERERERERARERERDREHMLYIVSLFSLGFRVKHAWSMSKRTVESIAAAGCGSVSCTSVVSSVRC
jgi:hypothetical protein